MADETNLNKIEVSAVDPNVYLIGLIDQAKIHTLTLEIREKVKLLKVEAILHDFVKPKPLHLRINSQGGEAASSLGFYDLLKGLDIDVIGTVEGMAASGGSLILMGCHYRIMTPNSAMMIHEPWGFTGGNVEEQKAYLRYSQLLLQQMVNIYHSASDISKGELRRRMKTDNWMIPAQALKDGFIHEIK